MKHTLFTFLVFFTFFMPLIGQKTTLEKSYSTTMTLLEYDSCYAAGDNSHSFLKNYIVKRQQAGLMNNDKLIEKYVLDLKVSDLNCYDQVKFILKAGPILNGNAYQLAKLNFILHDSIYKSEPLAVRVAIDDAIINNTLNIAIANKKIAKAFEVARYTSSSWGKNYQEGQKRFYFNMLRYYKGVNDTAKYLENATQYYDNFYLKLTVDSVKKLDSLNFIKARNNAREVSRTQIDETTVMKKYSFVVAKNAYAVDLNNAAWNFYNMANNKNDYLLKALIWVRRAIEVSPKPAFYDTYAHLLYRLKMYDEALSMQKKALELGNEAKIDINQLQIEYKKMKNRTL